MNKKILVIDDSEQDRYFVRRDLKTYGDETTVIEADNAAKGLKMIAEDSSIDFIFLDYMLPDSDGISVLKELYNKNTRLGPCPIIMLTGQGSEAVAMDALNLGAQDYLNKDIISKDTLAIAMFKASRFYELQKRHNRIKEAL